MEMISDRVRVEISSIYPYNIIYDIFKDNDIATNISLHGLRAVLESLPERYQQVIFYIYHDKLTMRKVGELMYISPTRVLELKNKSLRKIRYNHSLFKASIYSDLCAAESEVQALKREIEEKVPKPPITDLRINQLLILTMRATNCLKRKNINTINDLISITPDQLFDIPNLGVGVFKEILYQLKKFNLHLNEFDINESYHRHKIAYKIYDEIMFKGV